MATVSEPMEKQSENSQEVLAETNGLQMTTSHLLHSLKLHLNWHIFDQALLDVLIDELFVEHQIEASEDEVAETITSFREKEQLLSAKDTERWINEHGLSDEDFYDFGEWRCKLDKLKRLLFYEKAAEAFAFQKVGLEAVELYHIAVESEGLVKEISALLFEGADFYGLAKECSVDEASRKQCGYMGVVLRRSLPAEVEAAVFSVKEGQIAGPVKIFKKYHLYLVEKFYPAVLDDQTRTMLMDQLFDEYLNQRLGVQINGLGSELEEATLND